MLQWTDVAQYLITFALLVAAGFGFPIPEEAPIITGGIMVGHDQSLRWWIMLPVCILGVVISDGCLYGIGWFWGEKVLEVRWMSRILPRERLVQIQRNFQERGVLILLFARMLPGIRAPIFITAGIMKLSFRKFLLADGIYAIPGVSLLFFLAFWFTDQFKEVMMKVDSIRPIVIVAVIAAVGGYFVYHFLNRPVSTGDPKELPLIGDQVAARLGKSGVRDMSAVRDLLPPAEDSGAAEDNHQQPPQRADAAGGL